MAAKTAKTSQAKRELAASYIDHWVGRLKKGVPDGVAHLAETAINDKVEMRCGKRMTVAPLTSPKGADTLEGASGMAIDIYLPDTMAKCKTCVAKAAPGQIPGHDDETPFPAPGATTGLAGQPQ